MIVKKLRLQKGWSQEHLAELTGLTRRTIQRIEQGQKPSLDTQKALASVFEVDIDTFIPGDINMTSFDNLQPTQITITDEEKAALSYVRGLMGFYSHAITFVIFTLLAGIVLGVYNPTFLMLAGSWGISIIFHALYAFEIFTPISTKWEKKLIEKHLGRKL